MTKEQLQQTAEWVLKVAAGIAPLTETKIDDIIVEQAEALMDNEFVVNLLFSAIVSLLGFVGVECPCDGDGCPDCSPAEVIAAYKTAVAAQS